MISQIEHLERRRLLSNTIYVSTTGNDSSSNPSAVTTPLGTIQRAADLARPGDRVMVMGGTYRETVIPARSGIAGYPITYSPYHNQTVTVDGSDPLTGWVANGNGTFSAPLPAVVSTDADHTLLDPQIFFGGSALTDARWPGPGTDVYGSGGFATAGAGTGDGVIDDPTLSAGWTGGFVHYTGALQYVWQTALITGSSAGQISWSYPAPYSPDYNAEPGMPYYITDAPPALAAIEPGQWYIDHATDVVTVMLPNGTAPGDSVRIKTRNDAFDLSGRSFIHVTGLNLFGCTIATNASSGSDLISGITATYVSHFQDFTGNAFHTHALSTGIMLMGNSDTVQNSLIDFSAGDGISLTGYRDRAIGNRIENTDYSGTDAAGIVIVGNDQTASHNTIVTTGRDGIVARANKAGQFYNNRISFNDISNFGLMTHDLGGIYIGVVQSDGTIIDHNWIHDTASDRVTVNAATIAVGGSGIYLDQGTSEVTVIRNVVWDTRESSIIVNRSDKPFESPDGSVIQPSGSAYGDQLLFNTAVTSGPGGGSGNAIGVFATYAYGTVVRGNLINTPVIVGGAVNQGGTIAGNLVATAVPTHRNRHPLATQLLAPVQQAGAYSPNATAWTAGAV